jgi:hypothetical protein
MRHIPTPIITGVLGFCLAAMLLPIPPSIYAVQQRPSCDEVKR